MATRTKSTTTKRKSTPAGARRATAKSAAKKPQSTGAAPVASAKPPATAKPTSKVAEPASGAMTAKSNEPAGEAAPANEPAAEMPAADIQPSSAATERVRRGDLLDALSERSPMKRPELKLVMELVLEEMGRLLEESDEVVVPPLGKLSVKKRVSRPGGDMLTIKLKRPTGED